MEERGEIPIQSKLVVITPNFQPYPLQERIEGIYSTTGRGALSLTPLKNCGNHRYLEICGVQN